MDPAHHRCRQAARYWAGFAVIGILERAKAETGNGKPIAIILHTEMGAGVDYMMGSHAWHGKAPNAEQLENGLAQLTPDELSDY